MSIFYTSISRNYGDYKCKLWVMDLTHSKWMIQLMCKMLIIQEILKNSLICSNINVKHKVVMCFSIYISKCNMQHLNDGFKKFKMYDSTHVKMLIIQEMWKNSLNHLSIIAKHWLTCVSIYYNKCKM
jgi:hypothetical protein